MSTDIWADYRPLLSDHLDTEDLAPLLDRATLVEVEPGQVLLRDQETTDAMYLVLSGKMDVSVELGEHAIHMGVIEHGNWVGEVAYYTRCSKACSTVTAQGRGTLLRLGFEAYGDLQRSQSEVACRLAHLLIAMQVQRLRATVNDPVLDPEGRLLMLGDLSIPLDQQPHRHSGLGDFFRNLMGFR